MARTARRDGVGLAHHVMVRGIERRQIFLDDKDRSDYLGRLDRLLPEEGWRCFAWALMPNHVHLVIQSPRGGLSRLMARLNTGYARSFNLRHDRVGYLFQNRFKSRLVEDEADLIGLIAYVIRNPIAAKLVPSPRSLERYPWCNLSSLLGRTPARLFEAPEACLSLYAEDRGTARRRLRRWIAGSDDDPVPDLPRSNTGSMVGEDRVAGRVRAEHAGIRTLIPEGADPTAALDHLIKSLATDLDISKEVLLSPCRHGPASNARSLIAAAAMDELGLDRHQTGKILNISATAVTKSAQRGRQLQRGSCIRGDGSLPPLHPYKR